MGWGFRKSVKFGPLRLNFSKSGVGVSAGVKGARVSVGPRGTYLHAGRGPFYYRQKIGGSSRAPGGPTNLPPSEVVATVLPPHSAYQRPAFPKHGLPRIVYTLGVITLVALTIGFIVVANFIIINQSRRRSSTPAINEVKTPTPTPSPSPKPTPAPHRKAAKPKPTTTDPVIIETAPTAHPTSIPNINSGAASNR